MKNNYSNLFENSFDFGNDIGRLFLEIPCATYFGNIYVSNIIVGMPKNIALISIVIQKNLIPTIFYQRPKGKPKSK